MAEVEGEEKNFAVTRVQLEDDAGMLKHFSRFAGVDYNRAGVPLIEIVSEPCMHSAKQAASYAMAVKAILQYLDASDCNMEEGSLRFDANISVRPRGNQELRNRIEIKNMNSFSNLILAIESEINRQIAEYRKHPDTPWQEVIKQATYRWDPEKKQTVKMRRKEYAEDYRYFPEPDLVPLILSDTYIEEVRQSLPELPLMREKRYVKDYALPASSAFILTSEKQLADYFEKALKQCPHPRSVCNWIIVEFAGRFKDTGQNLYTSAIPPAHIGELVNLIHEGNITGPIAKQIADEMVAHPEKSPRSIIEGNPNYQPISDTSELEILVDKVLSDHPQSIEDFHKGKDRAFGFLVGQVMKLSKGKASPQIVNTLLKEKIRR